MILFITLALGQILADNIVLRAFKGINNRQYLSKSERDKENHFILSFSAPADTLPVLIVSIVAVSFHNVS